MMKPSSATISDSLIPAAAALRAQEIGALVLRYGLALVIAWIGFMKEVGQFLVKDVVLPGAAVWSFGEAWTCGARIPA